MTYRLYGDIGSGSAIIELALAELDLAVDLADVPLHENAQESHDYAAVNPQRKLPALVTPGGETLTETVAILLTLDERYPAGKLLPSEPRARARALRWLLFMATELYPIIEMVDYPRRFQPEGDATAAARCAALSAHAAAIWQRRFLIVESAVADREWFLDSGFSLLDIYVSVLSRWTTPASFRLAQLPGTERIATLLGKRSRLDRVWRRHFAHKPDVENH